MVYLCIIIIIEDESKESCGITPVDGILGPRRQSLPLSQPSRIEVNTMP